MTILFIGLGSIGQRHLRILKNLGKYNFIAVRSGKGKTTASELVDTEYSDIKELSGIGIDGAVISNPTSLHVETAIETAMLGIPMFIEKPLGKNLDRIYELEKIVKEKVDCIETELGEMGETTIFSCIFTDIIGI